MSLVFRGAVEDYEKTGIHPSVFMDGSGQLQIYLSDPVVDDPEFEEEMSIDYCEINGAQFSNTILERSELQEVRLGKPLQTGLVD